MQYYKVKEIADQKRIDRPCKKWFLVANELITIKEAKRENIETVLNKYADKIEVNKNKTHIFFGCRFQD